MLKSLLLCLALVSPALHAGVLVITTDKSLDEPDRIERTEIRIESDRISVETKGPDSHFGMIFRSDKHVMWTIDYDDRTYVEATRADLERMRSQMTDAMAEMRKQMAEQLKDLPPEQRAMVEQMLKGKMPQLEPAPEEKIAYKRVATGQRAGRWTCDKYEGYVGGQKVSEVCAVGWKEAGFDPKDLQVWRELGEFFKAFSPEAARGFPMPGSDDWEKEQGYPGIPVLEIDYLDGKPQSESGIEEIRRESFPASVFEVPAGFKKEQIPEFR